MTLGFCVCGHHSRDHKIRFVNDGECEICICDQFMNDYSQYNREKWDKKVENYLKEKELEK